MTDVDLATERRDIADALLTALDRRHEVLDAIVDADDHTQAVSAIAELLGKSQLGASAILDMKLDQLTKDERRRNQSELDDLNHQLTFTLAERPASSGDTVVLRAFSPSDDAELFAERTRELGVAGDGSGQPAREIDQEIAQAAGRVDEEEAAWLVVTDGTDKVGFVFGELTDGEVDVRVWVHPDFRKQGYATAAMRKARSEMAGYFPGVPMVVRAPGV
ncbi:MULTISPECIES: GNAT family N-acetyltransferase [Gordonia]|uniref:GNAT family N-acetyltransferase n=1 Tax=Gordonia TaxID=2053 RepID=UPI0007EB6AAD|nr:MULTISPECIES: GNAT family N-acetyltransferase [unclassified Gordonia (in: high G+C Gram-positive bacteria)]OBC10170.1 acetyltransferase [Gordonia sp. 852002-50395_SCH5434458]OBC17683.1 acetyltransferase [Gordonia sp. 852002-50816_SCH5313054-a]OBC19257.1 acetyltransferase [Gordonia sp. 852002-50816_SCH5313054-c]